MPATPDLSANLSLDPLTHLEAGELWLADRRNRFARRFYRLPRPCDTQADAERFAMADLAGMPAADLWREHSRVRLRLAVEDNPPGWLLRRLEAVELETRKRRRGGTS